MLRFLDVRPPWKIVEAILIFTAAMFIAYIFMALKVMLAGGKGYHYGDFFALWTSGLLAHQGEAAVLYDVHALHKRQIALGMSEHGLNPFSYPPYVLLVLGPLGGLPLPTAFALFMIPSFLAYLAAMGWGRWQDWWWGLLACIAPATTLNLISGQTGYLSGALMVGGLRLLPRYPALAGICFGLLTYKPQLGVLVPVALLAMRSWQAIAAAVATMLLCAGLYGGGLWVLMFHSLYDYAVHLTPVLSAMPTPYANMLLLGAPRWLAWFVQGGVAAGVGGVIWHVFAREGASERACALLLVGTFLATPHALNYDMPMMTFALVFYLIQRIKNTDLSEKNLDMSEIFTLLLGFLLPFLLLVLKDTHIPISFAPLGLLFTLIYTRLPAQHC